MITVGYDAIGINVDHLPAHSQVAGYTTGSGVVPWTAAQFAAHPGAVRIDQDPSASDPSADVLDVENGAATIADCPRWVVKAEADFVNAVRSGQREPAIYTSASNVTNVVNELDSAGIASGVGLWVAEWGLTESQAISDVQKASGPFPIIGIQYSNGTYYDYDIWATSWLSNVSGHLARNPVSDLHETRRGFNSVDLAWNAAAFATSYGVKTYWRGKLVKEETATTNSIRVGFLYPRHTYTFRVRAHPGGSQGTDAEVKVTTR